MKKALCWVILCCAILLGACKNTADVISADFFWDTETAFFSVEESTSLVPYSECLNDQCDFPQGTTCEMTLPEEDHQLAFLETRQDITDDYFEVNFEEYIFGQPESPHPNLIITPEERMMMVVADDADPENFTPENILLRELKNREFAMDTCVEIDQDDDEISLDIRECQIVETYDYYQLTFLSDLVESMLCEVIVSEQVQLDYQTSSGSDFEKISFPEMTAGEDETIEKSFTGRVIFQSSDGASYTQYVNDVDAYAQLIAKYQDDYNKYQITFKNGKATGIKLRKE